MEGNSSLSVQSHLMNSEEKLEVDRFAGYLIFDRIWSCLTAFPAWREKLLVGMEEKYCCRSLLLSDISDLLTFKKKTKHRTTSWQIGKKLSKPFRSSPVLFLCVSCCWFFYIFNAVFGRVFWMCLVLMFKLGLQILLVVIK